MKKIIAYAIIAFSFIYSLQSQAQDILLVSANTNTSSVMSFKKEKRLERIIDAYVKGLSNTSPTSIESSMFNLLVLRLESPYTDFSSSINNLSKLSVEGETPTIRYKAHITLQYIIDPALFLEVEVSNFIQNMEIEKADNFYLALSENLQAHITDTN